jgi:hypothetical protein
VAVFNHRNTNQLHLVYQCSKDNHIKHLWTTDLENWNEISLNNKWTTKDTPALVVYDGRLLMVNRGGGDEYLWYCLYDGTSWSGDESIIPGEDPKKDKAYSTHGVGLAVFDNKVFMVHRSNRNNGELWYSTYTTSAGWTGDRCIAGQSTGETPALACYKDPQVKPENYDKTDESYSEGVIASRLICVHRGWGKY